MRYKILFLLFFISCLLLAIFSYGFVDANFPLNFSKGLSAFLFIHRPLTTAVFSLLIVIFFVLYLLCLNRIKNHKYSNKQIWILISLVVGVLFFSWPAFSNDIFNYIATAKVTYFYKENPYLVMPIEFTNEPMLKFMHAANKTALYAPLWIILTAIPHFLGLGNPLLTVFTFKLFIVGFYLACCWLIWQLSKRNVYNLVFFALNPLVIIETLISGHNDVVMMAFILLAVYLLNRHRKISAYIFLLVSAGIKFATIILAPLFIFFNQFKKGQFIKLSVWLMLMVFLLSPIREEIYPWYFIWVITLAALIPQNRFWRWLVLAFSFSLLMRYTPFLYFRTYKGLTQSLKTIITLIPPGLTILVYLITKLDRKKWKELKKSCPKSLSN